MNLLTSLFLVCVSCLSLVVGAFIPIQNEGSLTNVVSRRQTFLRLLATSDKVKRAKILNRRGQHFLKNSGRIEFGYTTKLDTDLVNGDSGSIKQWLSDERKVASGIWDKNLMKNLGNNMYRLELVTLQFLTIQLAPSIDVLMWTENDPVDGDPVFKLESVSYDPNVQVLPGVGLDAKKLDIHIDVVGELRIDSKGTGLSGEIGFVSSGSLLPPMRLLPEPAVKAATGVINKTVANFAVRSFEKGAKEEYAKFIRENSS